MIPVSEQELEDYPGVTLHPKNAPWSKPVKKTVFTLNVSPDGRGNYAPEVCSLTYPLMRAYAEKIGAEFHIIKQRKFPEWPVVMEKLQIFELGRKRGNDWNIFFDSDTLISPEFFDVTEHLHKDTIAQNGKDMAGVRWTYDQYFRRDGRHHGACNWCAIASDWCLDLWHPLDDLTPEQAFKNIHITINEHNSGACLREHLIDDYTLSRNIARFGLKVKTIIDICGELGWKENGRPFNNFLYHLYAIDEKEKLRRLIGVLSAPLGAMVPHSSNPEMKPGGHPPVGVGWGLMSRDVAADLWRRWAL